MKLPETFITRRNLAGSKSSPLYPAFCLQGTVLLIGLLSMNGCARTPAGASLDANNQLIVEFSVAGQIDLNKHYFLAIDTSDDASQGPVPVISRPWGNGWGAGNITYFVQMDAAQPAPSELGFYSFPTTGDLATRLLRPTFLGRPFADTLQLPTSTVRFTLDLNQLLTPAGVPASQLKVNFIATDRIPLDAQDPSSKLVDALGTSGNGFVTINVQSSRIFRNSESSEPESQGDVADPSIDLVDWRIEVRKS